MEALAVAGITFGVTALLAAGTFSGWSTKIGRTVGRIETDVKATKNDMAELKITVKEGQEKNDADHEKIYGRVNDQGVELANLQGYLNGKDAKNQVRKRRTKKKE